MRMKYIHSLNFSDLFEDLGRFCAFSQSFLTSRKSELRVIFDLYTASHCISRYKFGEAKSFFAVQSYVKN